MDLRLIIVRDDAVLLTTSGALPAPRDAAGRPRGATGRDTDASSRSRAHAKKGLPQVWRLPGAPLRLGEPARETALRLATEVAGIRADASELTLAHAAHHRLGDGGEQVSLYFLPPGSPPADAPVPADTPVGDPAGGARTRWWPLAAPPATLDPLDAAVLTAWLRDDSYSEPGWHPVRPRTPGSLSPLAALHSR